jgi:hypothetical protein
MTVGRLVPFRGIQCASSPPHENIVTKKSGGSLDVKRVPANWGPLTEVNRDISGPMWDEAQQLPVPIYPLDRPGAVEAENRVCGCSWMAWDFLLDFSFWHTFTALMTCHMSLRVAFARVFMYWGRILPASQLLQNWTSGHAQDLLCACATAERPML